MKRLINLNGGALLIAAALILVVLGVSIWVFPENARSPITIGALAVTVVVGVFSFLANVRQALDFSSRIETNVELSRRGDISQLVLTTATRASAIHQLAPIPTDFTGRKLDMTILIDKAQKQNLVIEGQAGIGKTTLAQALAHRLAKKYRGGQLHINLHGLGHAPLSIREAQTTIIQSLTPESKIPERDDEVAALYLSTLAQTKTLLILDNARDLSQVSALIPPSSCLAIITSRQIIPLPGAFRHRLDCLAPEESVELLLKVEPRIAGHAVELAELCSFHPLALRLAGSTIAERPSFDPGEYVASLRNDGERVGLIAASLALSLKTLSNRDQRRWAELAVFPRSFSRRAACLVWGCSEVEGQTALDELVRRSILDWDHQAGRFRLHDLVHVVADDALRSHDKLRRHPLLIGLSRVVKRAVDIGLVTIGVLPLTPLLVLLAVAVQLESGPPAVISRKLLGLDGRKAIVRKYRTLKGTRGGSGPTLTHVGAFLRKFRLDEMPMHWSVLTGDLSLVGTYGLPLEWEEKLADWGILSSVWTRPGIIGPSKLARYKYDLEWEDVIGLDIHYARTWSIVSDFRTLVDTTYLVLAGKS